MELDQSNFEEFEFTVVVKVKQRGYDAADAFDRVRINLDLRNDRVLFNSSFSHTNEEWLKSTITQDLISLAHKRTSDK